MHAFQDAAVAVHLAARIWPASSPVGRYLRRIADRLSDNAEAIRRRLYDQQSH